MLTRQGQCELACFIFFLISGPGRSYPHLFFFVNSLSTPDWSGLGPNIFFLLARFRQAPSGVPGSLFANRITLRSSLQNKVAWLKYRDARRKHS